LDGAQGFVRLGLFYIAVEFCERAQCRWYGLRNIEEFSPSLSPAGVVGRWLSGFLERVSCTRRPRCQDRGVKLGARHPGIFLPFPALRQRDAELHKPKTRNSAEFETLARSAGGPEAGLPHVHEDPADLAFGVFALPEGLTLHIGVCGVFG